MIVYHGTTLEIQKPEIMKSEIGRDFGFAFYTTDIKEQSERWAIRKATIENRKPGKFCLPVVNVYEWDDSEAGLLIKAFDGVSLEWLDMVVNCRSDRTYIHPFDIVIGKIASDNVGETVSYAEDYAERGCN